MEPTTYRKIQVAKLQKNVTEAAEMNKMIYQEKTMSTRDTNVIFKHLKRLNKSVILPKVMVKGRKFDSRFNEKVNLLNDFSQSVYCLKKNLNVKELQPENIYLTNSSVTRE